uniref:Uncharacterized protein n=1 Tax=Parascaris univalens TaxID=6257 RepID=A0A914ZIY6_PARUN
SDISHLLSSEVDEAIRIFLSFESLTSSETSPLSTQNLILEHLSLLGMNSMNNFKESDPAEVPPRSQMRGTRMTVLEHRKQEKKLKMRQLADIHECFQVLVILPSTSSSLQYSV